MYVRCLFTVIVAHKGLASAIESLVCMVSAGSHISTARASQDILLPQAPLPILLEAGDSSREHPPPVSLLLAQVGYRGNVVNVRQQWHGWWWGGSDGMWLCYPFTCIRGIEKLSPLKGTK